jgi:hypothetical protein
VAAIIDRLQKLIAHERSAREVGNIAEAEAFAAKIQTMLTTHKLTMTDVEFEAQDTVDPIGQDEVCLDGRSTPTWQVYLAQSIARNFFCCVLGVSRENRQTFIGRDSDRLAAVEMFRYLVGLGLSLAAKEEQSAHSGEGVGVSRHCTESRYREGSTKGRSGFYGFLSGRLLSRHL